MRSSALQRVRHWLLACSLCAAILSPNSGEEYVELTAEIELNDWSYWFLEDRQETGSMTSRQARSIFQEPLQVRCVIGTDSWLMEGSFVQNSTVTRWFTGSNLVERTRITSPTAPAPKATNLKLRVSSPPVGHQYSRRYETKDGNPGRPVRVEDLFMDASGKVCWLAFCSGTALKGEGRRIPLPSALWKQFFSGDDFSDKTVPFEDGLGLPRSIEVLNAQKEVLLNYQVRSSTNVHGWEIPTEFYLVQYTRARTAGANSVELHLTAKGRVTSIGPGKKPEIPQDLVERELK